ncbi:MAG TPA: hypothetical protein PLV13_07215 [Ilumatobacteraceae bacterium]|nr:hypothetical protein [Ilumatobacteraceae bacterium]
MPRSHTSAAAALAATRDPRAIEIEGYLTDHGTRMVGAVALLTGDRFGAEDALQDALTQAWRRRSQPIDQLMAKAVADAVEQARTRKQVDTAEARVARREALRRGEDLQVADGYSVVLRSLPHREQVYVVLRAAFDHSSAEIAAALGARERAVDHAVDDVCARLGTTDQREVLARLRIAAERAGAGSNAAALTRGARARFGRARTRTPWRLYGVIAVLALVAGGVLGYTVLAPDRDDGPSVSITTRLGLYDCPDGAVVGQVGAGDRVLITGRDASGAWWRVRDPHDSLTERWAPVAALQPDRVDTETSGDDAATADVPVVACGQPLTLAPPTTAAPACPVDTATGTTASGCTP